VLEVERYFMKGGKSHMKTLEDTLLYLFEETERIKGGSFKVSDTVKVSVVPNATTNGATFKVVGEPNDEDLKKILSFIFSSIKKHGILSSFINMGKGIQAEKGIRMINAYLEKKKDEVGLSAVDVKDNSITLMKSKEKVDPRKLYETPPKKVKKVKTKEEKEADEEEEASKNTPDGIGVKRVHKVFKNADGSVEKVVKEFYPKENVVKKLEKILKKQDGSSVEIYSYITRAEAKGPKEKKGWIQRLNDRQEKELAKIRETPEKEVKTEKRKYYDLLRSLRERSTIILNSKKTSDEPLPEEVLTYMRSLTKKSLGNPNIMTDWENFDKEKQRDIILDTVRTVAGKYPDYFK
jgi:hypothetical protein